MKKINKNNLLIFGEKRDSDGLLLKNTGYELTIDIINVIYNKILKEQAYKKFKIEFNNIYFDNYLKKLLFLNIQPIANQISILNWMIKTENKDFLSNSLFELDYSSFECHQLYPQITKFINKNNNEIRIKILKHSLFQNYVNKLKFFSNIFLFTLYSFYLYIYFFFKKETINNIYDNKKKIALTYCEGIDIYEKKSSIFWIKNANTDFTKNIIVYFENLKEFIDNKKLRKKVLDDYKITSIFLPKYLNLLKHHHFKDIIKYFVFKNFDINNWLNSKNLFFKNRYFYYYNFFSKHNIVLHSDFNENMLNTIIKQASLKDLNGLSFGRIRSYEGYINGKLYFSFPNNIYFLWGNDSLERFKNKILLKNENSINTLVISGFYNNPIKFFNKQDPKKISEQFKSLDVKKTFLLLDTNIDENKNYFDQLLPKKYLNNFYNNFFSLLIDNKEIGIIIKRKKNFEIDSLNKKNKLFQTAIESKRLCIIDDFANKPASIYSNICDVIIAITVEDLPSALLECFIPNKRLIILDYSNFKCKEKLVYEYGYNNFIYNNFNQFFFKLKQYILNNQKSDHFGVWPKNIFKFNDFNDYLGDKRILYYLQNMYENLNKKYDLKSVVKKTNSKYIKKFGKDKVFTFN